MLSLNLGIRLMGLVGDYVWNILYCTFEIFLVRFETLIKFDYSFI